MNRKLSPRAKRRKEERRRRAAESAERPEVQQTLALCRHRDKVLHHLTIAQDAHSYMEVVENLNGAEQEVGKAHLLVWGKPRRKADSRAINAMHVACGKIAELEKLGF